MERRNLRAGEGTPAAASTDDRSSQDARSGSRSPLSRSLHQNRAFHELARLVATGEHGLWTGALPILLGPAGASWGVAYRLVGSTLELAASEALPVGPRGQVEAFDMARHSAFAACRAVRSRRTVSDERVFVGIVDPRTAVQLDVAGISAGTAVPIACGGTVLGVLVIGAATREALDAESLAFLDAAASLLAPAVALLEAKRPPADTRVSTTPPPRPSSPVPPRKAADAGRAALDAIQQMGPLVRRMVTDIRTAVDDDCIALGDAGDLRIAVVHLVANAVEAAAERAPLSTSPSSPRRVRVSVKREGSVIAVCVEDSGRGVPADSRTRVFEAGFSTKGRGRGNGLYLVRQIARAQGGHVEIGASDLGGASFRMVLPASAARFEAGGSVRPKRSDSATLPRFRAPSERSARGGGGEDEGEPEMGARQRRAAVS